MNLVVYPSMLRNYYQLRHALAKRRFDAVKEREDISEDEYNNLWYVANCWKEKVNKPAWYEKRHHCTHHRHGDNRNRHGWHRWRLGYNHYPITVKRSADKEYSYYLLFWGYKGHRAVDIVFKWNLYCFSLKTGKPDAPLPTTKLDTNSTQST